MISTLVCDEHLLYAESLAAALQRDGAPAVHAIADVAQAVAALSPHPPARPAAPATVVISLRSRPRAGLAAVRELRDRWPGNRVVCLTGGADEMLEREATESGADRVLRRTSPLSQLVSGVRGGPSCPPASVPTAAPGSAARRAEPLHLRFLTTRERQVFELLVAARPTEGIAEEMGITIASARGYVQSVLEKLGVHSRVQAVALAARHARALPCPPRYP
jgi:two-component system nitrate/nitrite response regulator NarL